MGVLNEKRCKMSSILSAFNMYVFAKTPSVVPGAPRKIHCAPAIDYPRPLCLYDHYHSDDDSELLIDLAMDADTELATEVPHQILSDESSNTSPSESGVHPYVTMHRGNHYYSYDSDDDDVRGEMTLSELAIDVETDVPHPNVTGAIPERRMSVGIGRFSGETKYEFRTENMHRGNHYSYDSDDDTMSVLTVPTEFASESESDSDDESHYAQIHPNPNVTVRRFVHRIPYEDESSDDELLLSELETPSDIYDGVNIIE